MDDKELLDLGFTQTDIDDLKVSANGTSNKEFGNVKKDLYAKWEKEESKGYEKRKAIAKKLVEEQLEKEESEEEKARRKQALLKLLMQQEYFSMLYGLRNDALTYANVTIELSEKSEAGIQYKIVEEPLIENKKTKLQGRIEKLKKEELHTKLTSQDEAQRNEAKNELKKQKAETEALCKKINNLEMWKDISSLGDDLEGATLDLAAQLEVWQENDSSFPADQEEENCLKALKNCLKALKKIRIVADIRRSAEEVYEKEKLFPEVDRKDKDKEKAIRALMVKIQEDFINVANENMKAEDKKVIKEQKSVQGLIKEYAAYQSAGEDINSSHKCDENCEHGKQKEASRKRRKLF